MFIYTPYQLLAGNLGVACYEFPMEVVASIYNIGVGLSALLVSTNRAIPEPLERGTSNRRLHVSFLYPVLCLY